MFQFADRNMLVFKELAITVSQEIRPLENSQFLGQNS